jgi:uncharacterized protein
MSSQSFGLSEDTLVKINQIFRRYPGIKKVIVYGSRAKGNFRPNSDIDLTIISDGFSTTELLQVENELEDLLLPYEIDLSIYSQIENTDLTDHIDRVGQVFYMRSL